ncbi:hypothetical protein [Mycetocola spongiae]|uniref:hypothetical protein n=1 Tax=Mycetocola spongiae TaxID=2859226 RepID=UPI001CF273D8|nr:hypothetical protein [Mycetocola spongiae]UCR90317.1 hypothetical protein KXZ72_06625 [Mycetocola spongiae]
MRIKYLIFMAFGAIFIVRAGWILASGETEAMSIVTGIVLVLAGGICLSRGIRGWRATAPGRAGDEAPTPRP